MSEPRFDYSGVDTSTLAQESLAKAALVNEVNDAAFDAVVPAFVASMPFAIAVPFAWASLVSERPPIRPDIAVFILILTIAIAAPFVLKWCRAIRDCNAFTKEMKARTAELRKRNQLSK